MQNIAMTEKTIFSKEELSKILSSYNNLGKLKRVKPFKLGTVQTNLLLETTKTLLNEYSKYRKLTKMEKSRLYDFLKMVIFMSIGWFIHVDEEFTSEK